MRDRKPDTESWCDCPGGPQPVVGEAPPPEITGFALSPQVRIGEACDLPPIVRPRRILYRFWKPITTPVDVKLAVAVPP